jgi:hypothetical protein
MDKHHRGWEDNNMTIGGLDFSQPVDGNVLCNCVSQLSGFYLTGKHQILAGLIYIYYN